MDTRRTEHTQGSGAESVLSFTEIENAATNSIEVTRNAKGDYQWSIKVYHRPDEDALLVTKRIAFIDEDLRHKFLEKITGGEP